MKFICTAICLLSSLWLQPRSLSQDTQRVLEAWVATQNDGSEKAIRQFIDSYYSPAVLKGMKNYDDHVKFYQQVIAEFGQIQSHVFEVEVDEPHTLKVQLIKKGTPLVPSPGPEEVLVVEIDLDPEQPQYLKRGLGMGALICYLKR